MQKIQTIFEDNDYLVINKPAGLVVHGDGKTDEPSVADWMVENHPDTANVGEPMIIDDKEIQRPGIVHRLDRDTSGCLILAKNQNAFEHLKNQFQNSTVKKEYIGIVWGNIIESSGTVDASIGRSPKDFRQWSAMRGKRGKLRDAVTDWRVLHRAVVDDEPVSIVQFMPKTGRTHQIRVHAKYMNHPLVCDKLYTSRGCVLGLDRHALHAHVISFVGMDNEQINVQAPIPDDLQRAFDEIGLV
ncbi:MAG: RluA family pseudouridine synthase [Candidatus Nomurabacteria bacterium]|nr:RluA family pseudouridine synthase [Candidatus Nomurabacteria bacterium]